MQGTCSLRNHPSELKPGGADRRCVVSRPKAIHSNGSSSQAALRQRTKDLRNINIPTSTTSHTDWLESFAPHDEQFFVTWWPVQRRLVVRSVVIKSVLDSPSNRSTRRGGFPMTKEALRWEVPNFQEKPFQIVSKSSNHQNVEKHKNEYHLAVNRFSWVNLASCRRAQQRASRENSLLHRFSTSFVSSPGLLDGLGNGTA